MKKRKFSLLLNIATIALCVCAIAIAIGVYSAKTASLSITGSIGFEAHDCKVKVKGSVSGVNETIAPYQEDDGSGKLISGNSETWNVNDITFNDLNCSNDQIATPIVFTFEMENMSAYDVAAEIKLVGDMSTKIKSSVEYTSTSDSYTEYSGYVCVLPQTASGSTAVKVTAKVTLLPATDKDFGTAIDLSNFSISFTKPTITTETSGKYEYGNMYFTINSTTKTAIVNAYSSISGDVVIPAVIIAGEEIYIVETINYEAFRRCSNLSSIIIPSSVTQMGPYAFASCSSLISINIPTSLTQIGEFAFSSCSGLTSVTMTSNIISMGMNAFEGCSSLTSITGFGNIGYKAFNNCDKLDSVILFEGVTFIGSYTFGSCTSLTSITIPSSLNKIYVYAFEDCTSLTSITYKGTKAQWEAIIKESKWDESTGSYTIHCTDGDIPKAS